MAVHLIGALALAASSLLDVPYVPQSQALCGGAAVAMVYRYWGDAHAGAAEFASLVDRRAGGIVEGVLAEAVRRRGWTAAVFEGSINQLQTSLSAAGQSSSCFASAAADTTTSWWWAPHRIA